LKWVTHSRPKQDQMDDYTTLLWTPLCEEVAKLKVRLRREPARIAAIANAAAGATQPDAPPNRPPSALRSRVSPPKPRSVLHRELHPKTTLPNCR
jgi:hypothetical protein